MKFIEIEAVIKQLTWIRNRYYERNWDGREMNHQVEALRETLENLKGSQVASCDLDMSPVDAT
jgi:hypothetical protein